MNAGGGIPLPPPNLRQATDMMTEIDLCPIERMERALDREIEAAMGVKCHVPAGGIGSKCPVHFCGCWGHRGHTLTWPNAERSCVQRTLLL